MSGQPWRGGFSNRGGYSSRSRGGYNPRYQWDNNNQHVNGREYRRGSPHHSTPVYMNSDDSSRYWRNFYRQGYAPQFQEDSYCSNEWNPCHRDSQYTNPPNNRSGRYNDNLETRQNKQDTSSDSRTENSYSNKPSNVSASSKKSPHATSSSLSTSKRHTSTPELETNKTVEEETVAHPGSEAARERQRAEIAERLKLLDKQQDENRKEVGNIDVRGKNSESNVPKRPSHQKRSISRERDAKRRKRDYTPPSTKEKSSRAAKYAIKDKSKDSSTQRKVKEIPKKKAANKKLSPTIPSAASKKSSASNKKSEKTTMSTTSSDASTLDKSADLKDKIKSRLAAMGKDELRKLINDPRSQKAQEMMKALMLCYQEMKALELDKRRFTIAPCNNQSQTVVNDVNSGVQPVLLNSFDLPSIEMSDLPFEIVSQIETFLGCNLGMNFQAASQNLINIRQNPTIPPHQSPVQTNSPSLGISSNEMQFHNPPPPPPFIPDICADSIYNGQNPSWQQHGEWTNLPSTSRENGGVEHEATSHLHSPGGCSEATEPAPEDNISESSTEKAPSIFSPQFCDNEVIPEFNSSQPPLYFNPILPQFNEDDEHTPFHILNELSIIDLRIQADVQRKMQLYKQLHEYLQKHVSRENNPLNALETNNLASLSISPQPSDIPTPLGVRSNLVSTDSEAILKSQSVTCTSAEVAKQPSTQYSRRKGSSNPLKEPIILTLDDNDDSDSDKSTSAGSQQAAAAKNKQISLPQQVKKVSKRVKFIIPDHTKVNDMKVIDNTVFVACEDCIIYAYDVTTGKQTHKYCEHTAMVTAILPIKLSSEEGAGSFKVCSGSLDEHLCIFNSETSACVSKHYLASRVNCLASPYPHELLYIGLQCGQVLKYNISRLQLLEGQLDCGTAVLSILATREGPRKVLIISSAGNNIIMRDAQSGLLLRTFQSSWQDKTFSMASYGNMLLCGSMKKCIPYYNLQSGMQEGELLVSGNVAHIKKYKHLLFAACYNGQVFIFDLRTKQKVMEFAGAAVPLRTVQIKFNLIVTCGRSKKMEAIRFPAEMVRHLRNTSN